MVVLNSWARGFDRKNAQESGLLPEPKALMLYPFRRVSTRKEKEIAANLQALMEEAGLDARFTETWHVNPPRSGCPTPKRYGDIRVYHPEYGKCGLPTLFAALTFCTVVCFVDLYGRRWMWPVYSAFRCIGVMRMDLFPLNGVAAAKYWQMWMSFTLCRFTFAGWQQERQIRVTGPATLSLMQASGVAARVAITE